MKQSEVIIIRRYIKNSFSIMKDDDDSSDAVWFDMLQHEDYNGILSSLKRYIRDGNKYPPSIGELIKGYNVMVLEFNNAVLDAMDKDGYFSSGDDDPTVERWNYDNRKRKAIMWASKDYPKEAVPDWFLKDYKDYEEKVKAVYFLDTPQRLRIT